MYDKGSNTQQHINKKRTLLNNKVFLIVCSFVILLGFGELISYLYTEKYYPIHAQKEDLAKIEWANEHLDRADSIVLLFIDFDYQHINEKPHRSRYVDVLRKESGYCPFDHKNAAYKILRKMAEAGYSNGQFLMGRYYMCSGESERGEYWYSKAAEQGNPRAMNNLAIYYWDLYDPSSKISFYNASTQIAKINKALSLWRQSISLGNAKSSYNLGCRFSSGIRVEYSKFLYFKDEGYREVTDYQTVLQANIDSARYYWNKALELTENNPSSEIRELAKEQLEKVYE